MERDNGIERLSDQVLLQAGSLFLQGFPFDKVRREVRLRGRKQRRAFSTLRREEPLSAVVAIHREWKRRWAALVAEETAIAAGREASDGERVA